MEQFFAERSFQHPSYTDPPLRRGAPSHPRAPRARLLPALRLARREVSRGFGGSVTLFAAFGGKKKLDPLVVKDSFLRGSPIEVAITPERKTVEELVPSSGNCTYS